MSSLKQKSTIDTLPPEMLCKIFLMTLLPRSAIFGHPGPPLSVSICSPMHISHVCRSWQSLTFSYGMLWSYLSIRFNYLHKRKEWEAAVEVFNMWLQRTNGSPLNFMIFFNLRSIGDDKIHRMAEYVVTTFLACQRRWRDVDLRWFELRPSPGFARVHVTDMPMLKSLTLYFTFSGCRKPCTICIGESPFLKRMQCEAFDIETGDDAFRNLNEASRSLLRTRFPLRRATQLCLALLRATPRMTAIHFRFRVIPEKQVETEAITSNLKALKLPSEGCNWIIDNLTLPSLEILVCGRPCEEMNFLDFTKRSMPPLTHLRLCDGDEETLIPALQLLPTLQVLLFGEIKVSVQFFLALTLTTVARAALGTADTSESYVCPALLSLRLRSLWMKAGTNALACVKAMLMMFKSRGDVLTRRNKIVEENLGMSDMQIRRVLYSFRTGEFLAEAEDVPLGPGRFWPIMDW